MKLIFYVLITLLSILSCGRKEQKKSLLVKDQVFDFGKIVLGDTAQHKFSFTNVGTQTVYITDIKPSCTCIASHLNTSAIDPQQSINILVKYVPVADDATLDDVDRMIAVRTTDVQKIIILHMRGKVLTQ